MPPNSPTEADVARIGLAFAKALADSEWASAHAMLADELRNDSEAADLEREYGAMTSYWDRPAESVSLGDADSDWAFVRIDSTSAEYGSVLEAVHVRVVFEAGHPRIAEVVWGRP